jgi:hypothetical protein
MVTLDAGNVLLKPSNRKQLMSWLRRALRLGQRVADFALNITMHRTGRQYEMKAVVRGANFSFDCRSRRTDWQTAGRELVRTLVNRLHDLSLHRSVA